MPEVYKDFIARCKDNIIMLDNTHFTLYMNMWNDMHPQYSLKNHEALPSNTKNDYLKRFYLYFEGGIYSDFDTEINEKCW